MIGVPGSLFQKCSSFMEASLRLAQAWMIGGIIYQIPESVLLPGTTDTWLEAFARSPMRALQIPSKAMPMLGPVPPCSASGAPDAVLDADVMGGWWKTFVPGRKPARDYPATLETFPQVVFAPRDAPPSPSSTSSWDSGDSSPSSQHSASHTVVVPVRPSTSACGDSEKDRAVPRGVRAFQTGSSRASTRPDEDSYVAIVCGKVPWLFADG